MSQKKNNSALNKSTIFLSTTLTLLIVLFAVNLILKSKYSNRQFETNTAYYIDIQFVELVKTSDSIQYAIEKSGVVLWKKITQITNSDHSGCYIYLNDSLCYWNTYTVTQNIPRIANSQGDTIVQLNNGIYLVHQQEADSFSIITFKILQYEYQVENNLLQPKFNTGKKLPGKLSVHIDNTLSSHLTKIEKAGIYEVYISREKYVSLNMTDLFWFFLVYLITYIFITLTIFSWINNNKYINKNQLFKLVIYIISMVTIRYADFYFGFIPLLQESSLFTNSISPFQLFSTEGDIIINASIILIGIYLFLNNIKLPILKSKPIYMMVSYFILTWAFMAFIFHYLFYLLVNNEYSLNPEFFSEHNSNWTLLSIIILLNGSVFLMLTGYSKLNSNYRSKLSYTHLFPFALIPIILLFKGDLFTVAILSWIIITLVIFADSITAHFRYSIVEVLLIIFLLSAANALMINQTSEAKDIELQQYTARTLSQKNDPLLEYEFTLLQNRITQDTSILNILYTEQLVIITDVEQYLANTYFHSTFQKYKIQITICDSSDLLDIEGENDLLSCADYFNDFKTAFGKMIGDSSLYLIDTHTENIYYLGILNFSFPDQQNKQIYLEFVASYVPEGLGYPELLIDQKAQTYNLTNVSYARYYDHTLFYKFGDYPYPIILSNQQNTTNEPMINEDGYRHFTIPISNIESIIVSEPIKSTNLEIFPFSMLFLLFASLTGFYYLIGYILTKGVTYPISFRTKLQLFIISTIIITTVMLAMVTVLFMKKNAIDQTKKQLEEKTYSVFIELQHKLGQEISFTKTDNEHLETLLKKFSLVFFSDINLYEPSGQLGATSRPEMEEKGLLSNMINPEAYQALIIDHKPSFITQEQIGSLTYYSSYLALFLTGNKPQAIINLPYFARQSEITATYSNLLATFINLAVLIGIIGTVFTLIISRFLTRPLLILQKRMADIQIDKPNKVIDWHNNDEIGQLINQYNLMVEKLEVSAELLKHSERESTWREMARQIAHEIKNPLTPMKLNVQYLEKAYLEKQPDFQNRLTSTTKSLIEQIETLNNVAEMFGEVATSTVKSFKTINVTAMLSSVVEFFNNNPDIKFITQFPDQPCYIEAIEKDLIRVMNNLIKNAVQSFTNQSDEIIRVLCTCENNRVIISISDNGKGISTEAQQSIFKPYFTTKTSGTGLGLAIVKSIMNENNGQISFISTPGEGSTFRLVFHKSIP